MIQYFGMKACYAFAFPWIYDELTSEQDPSSLYEAEPKGLAELKKVLDFVQNDEYYPEFEFKCAYLLCSIVSSHAFENGNKRLGVTILLMFLQKNNALIFDDYFELKSLIKKYFPKYKWEENKNLEDAHSLFIYNLAIVIADRPQWSTKNFNEMRTKVTKIFREIYWINKNQKNEEFDE